MRPAGSITLVRSPNLTDRGASAYASIAPPYARLTLRAGAAVGRGAVNDRGPTQVP